MACGATATSQDPDRELFPLPRGSEPLAQIQKAPVQSIWKAPNLNKYDCEQPYTNLPITVCVGETHKEWVNRRWTVAVIELAISYFSPAHDPIVVMIYDYAEFEKKAAKRFPHVKDSLLGRGTIIKGMASYENPEALYLEFGYPPSDELLVHETLHGILHAIAVRDVLHNHIILEEVLKNIMTDMSYKMMLKSRTELTAKDPPKQ
jgi:hypothetical protein